MAYTLGEYSGGGWLRSLDGDTVDCVIDITIGATGAVSATDAPSGFSISRSAQGVYALVYPACAKAYMVPTIESADATPPATKALVTAKSATAGTATIGTYDDAAAATDPESGAHLVIYFRGRVRA